MPTDATEVDWSKSWDSARGNAVESCGSWIFGRKDGSAIIVAVGGAGTAYDLGLENLTRFPRDLILFVETCRVNHNWMEPKDCDLQDFDNGVNCASSEYGGGFHVCFADGAVWYLRSDVPPQLLRKFLTQDTAALLDRDVILAPFAIVKRVP